MVSGQWVDRGNTHGVLYAVFAWGHHKVLVDFILFHLIITFIHHLLFYVSVFAWEHNKVPGRDVHWFVYFAYFIYFRVQVCAVVRV